MGTSVEIVIVNDGHDVVFGGGKRGGKSAMTRVRCKKNAAA
jgi:hypothetical protein